MPTNRTRALVGVLALSLLTAACGDNKDQAGSGGCDVQVSGAANAKPTITVPNCNPPTTLQTKDIIVGTGPEATLGANAMMHYTLVDWATKGELQSSYDGGQPFPLQNIGQAQVIDAWNEGLVGIKQGGRRLLVSPPDKAYGNAGHELAGKTLVFVVDAVQVTAPR